MSGGLRERKKADTRRALIDTAVRLCLERGYGQVTIADVTDAAGVSRRTFSNYFDSLPQCLAAFGLTVLDDLVAELGVEPADRSPSELLRIGLSHFAERLAGGFDAYADLMAEHPDLVGAELALQQEVVGRLRGIVVRLFGADPEDEIQAQVLAGFVLQLAHTVGRWWSAQGRPGGVDGLRAQLFRAAGLLDLTSLGRSVRD